MNVTELAQQIIGNYVKHGWTLRRALLRAAVLAELDNETKAILNDCQIVDADFDALWFARGSHSNREAWELRMLAENPYALFEMFEADESEEDREQVRREMEARMREHLGPRP